MIFAVGFRHLATAIGAATTGKHPDGIVVRLWHYVVSFYHVASGILAFVALIVGVIVGIYEWRTRNPTQDPKAFTPSTERTLESAITAIDTYNALMVADVLQRGDAPFIASQRWSISSLTGTSSFEADDANSAGARLLEEIVTFGAIAIEGSVGVGKTYALNLLAKSLSDTGKPFVFLDATSWTSGRYSSFVGWLRDSVAEQYHISSQVAAELLLSGRVVLLIDDADEGDPEVVDANLRALGTENKDLTGLRFCATVHVGRIPSLTEVLRARTTVRLEEFTPSAAATYLQTLGVAPTDAAELSRHPALCSPLVLSRIAAGSPEIGALLAMPQRDETSIRSAVWTSAIEAAAANDTKYSADQIRTGLHWIADALETTTADGGAFDLGAMNPNWMPTRRSRLIARRLIAVWVLPPWLLFQAVLAAFRHQPVSSWVIVACASWSIAALAYYVGSSLPVGRRRGVPTLVAKRRVRFSQMRVGALGRLIVSSMLSGAVLGLAVGAAIGVFQGALSAANSSTRETVLWTVVLVSLFALGRTSGAILGAVSAAVALGIVTDAASGATVGLLFGVAMHTISAITTAVEASEAPALGIAPQRSLLRSWAHNGAFDCVKWLAIGVASASLAALNQSTQVVLFMWGAAAVGALLYGLVVAGIPTFNYFNCSWLLRADGVIPETLAGFLHLLLAEKLIARVGNGFAYELAHQDLRKYLGETR